MIMKARKRRSNCRDTVWLGLTNKNKNHRRQARSPKNFPSSRSRANLILTMRYGLHLLDLIGRGQTREVGSSSPKQTSSRNMTVSSTNRTRRAATHKSLQRPRRTTSTTCHFPIPSNQTKMFWQERTWPTTRLRAHHNETSSSGTSWGFKSKSLSCKPM